MSSSPVDVTVPTAVPAAPEPRGGSRGLLVALAVVFVALLAIPVVMMAGLFFVRGSVAVSSDQGVESNSVFLTLDGVSQGCADLGGEAAGGAGAGVACVDTTAGQVAVDVIGLVPGSKLTVRGARGDTVVLSVESDGSVRSTLEGQLVESPIELTGTMAGEVPVTILVELLDLP